MTPPPPEHDGAAAPGPQGATRVATDIDQQAVADSPSEIHHSHRDVSGGWLRPAVFGAMDGLVSNLSLIAGVAGGQLSRNAVLLTGFAGLIAGACSMAAGEYTSVASQSELVRAEIEVERRELDKSPRGELRELAELYIARGVEPDLAFEVARQISRNPRLALEVHAREELGVDPNDLPSPLVAAGSSFVSFAVGAVLPLLPYLLGGATFWPAVVLAAIGLFVCGAVVARVTTRTWWYSGTRQLLLGLLAAGLTFGLGRLFGSQVG